MLLQKAEEKYWIKEIKNLHGLYLPGVAINKVKYFVITENGELQAVSTAKNLHDHWRIKTVIVKPEHRGKGLQRKLMQEELDYLKSKTKIVRASVDKNNKYSIDNFLREGFKFEKILEGENREIFYQFIKNLN